jgi:ubiquinone/menaquinone biosynthesis C-methylase UbiE
MAFSEYSDYYDLYYARKDYAAEADFVLKLASRLGVKPQTLLDMGCGTGRHLEEFVKRGLKCDGFDLSTEMLSQASKRLAGTDVGLSEGNITDFGNRKQYDLVVAIAYSAKASATRRCIYF